MKFTGQPKLVHPEVYPASSRLCKFICSEYNHNVLNLIWIFVFLKKWSNESGDEALGLTFWVYILYRMNISLKIWSQREKFIYFKSLLHDFYLFWMSEYISFVHNVKFSYLFTIFFSYKYMFSWMIYSPNWFFYRWSRSIFHILKKHTNQTPKLLWGIICMKLAKQPKCMR